MNSLELVLNEALKTVRTMDSQRPYASGQKGEIFMAAIVIVLIDIEARLAQIAENTHND